tara:strand:- start:1598 stop:2059 length:462 start_codon:yes stop_codon:yes gene_type:complete
MTRQNNSGILFENRSVYFDKDNYPKIKTGGKSRFVHVLVWESVNGLVPVNMTINHKNGEKKDWCIDNLELLSQGDNVRHAWANGLCFSSKGEKHGRAKLDDMKVLTARTLPEKAVNGRGYGWSHVELAKRYDVSSKVLREARKGITWQHLPRP